MTTSETNEGRMLAGRVAVVTGGGGGIGAAVARALAAAGASVVVNDIGASLAGDSAGDSRGAKVAESIVAAGGRAVSSEHDISSFDDAAALVQSAVDSFGSLDVLVNVAGIVRDRMIFNMSEDEWDSVIRVHLKGTFNTSRHAAAWWRANRGGEYRLLNVTSGAGFWGAPGQPNYAAAKMGIIGLTLSCANSLRRYGVSSIAVWPSATTRMTASMPAERAAQVGVRTDDEMSPENIAPGFVYLASARSGWLNGQTVSLRGHRMALFSPYETRAEIIGTQPWTPAAAGEAMERHFKPALGNENIFSAAAE